MTSFPLTKYVIFNFPISVRDVHWTLIGLNCCAFSSRARCTSAGNFAALFCSADVGDFVEVANRAAASVTVAAVVATTGWPRNSHFSHPFASAIPSFPSPWTGPFASAASVPAALTVEAASTAGTPADAAFCVTTAASVPTESTTPCRASRRARMARARERRTLSVPSGQPSCRAASRRERPSMSQETTAARRGSDKRLSSRSSSGARSSNRRFAEPRVRASSPPVFPWPVCARSPFSP